MQFFQVNVQYERQTGEDNPSKVKEAYLVNAVSCGDAEKATLEKIKPYIFGECETPKIQKRQFFDVFTTNPNPYWEYYEAKVEMITIDGDKESRNKVNILLQAVSLVDAVTILVDQLKGYDSEIISLKKSAVTDIIEIKQDK